MKLHITLASAFIAIMATGALGQEHNCGTAVTCNNGSINKDNISQDIVSTDNVYAPDTATATASVGDVIAQGGTGGNATSHGNQSTNNNQSNANNTAHNTMTNGSISNDVTGGNITSTANTSGGNITSNSSTTSGPATTNSGNISTAGGNASGGNASIGDTLAHGGSATGGAATGGSSRATGGKSASNSASRSNSGGNRMTGGNSTNNIDASQRTTVRHSASTAAMSNMQAYGPGNCFGDTNPSGGFQASMQTFGWGVAASSHKASNVCALAVIAGDRAALAYLAQVDRNVAVALKNNGLAVSVHDRRVVQQETQTQAAPRAARLACPDGYTLVNNGQRMVCRLGGQPAPVAAATPTCPAGSVWDGKGCWDRNLRRR